MTTASAVSSGSTATLLDNLDETERYARFDQLQARMPAVWDAMRLNLEGESVVVLPSVTLDSIGERSGALTQAYEERFLFLLLLLRQPRLRMVYLTSMPVAPQIVEYYLALLPGVIPSHARARLKPGDRGDQHDPAVPARDHAGQQQPGQLGQGHDVDLENLADPRRLAR